MPGSGGVVDSKSQIAAASITRYRGFWSVSLPLQKYFLCSEFEVKLYYH